jgi:hypothetical protein
LLKQKSLVLTSNKLYYQPRRKSFPTPKFKRRRK